MDLTARGSSTALVEEQLRRSQGWWAVVSIAFTIFLSILGIWLARKVLKKYSSE